MNKPLELDRAASPKKVAFIATVYRHLEAFHIPFMNLLRKKGIEVHAIGCPDHGKNGLLAEQFICHDIPFHRNPFYPANIKAYKKLTQILKLQNYQMVHVHTPVGSILGRYAAWKTGVPNIIYTAHGFHFYSGGAKINWIYYPIEKMFSKITDTLITINQEDFDRARSFPVRKQVLFIPGVGIDITPFELNNDPTIRLYVRKEFGFNEDDFVIICVAELNKNKNQLQLIKAIHQLNNPSIKCLFVGIGTYEEKLRYETKKLLLDEQIKFCGFRRDIPQLLAASDVFCLMSKREGLPKAIMEALAAKKPVIATNIRGNRDLVSHRHNGLLVPVGDVNATASAIRELFNNPELRKDMGKTSGILAQNYKLQTILAQMELVYEKIFFHFEQTKSH